MTEERARKIVDTAVELAEQGGFEAVRLRDVASNAGVALGTLYRHFRSKEDLLVGALTQEVQVLVEQMSKEPPRGENALERVTAYFTMATRTMCRKPKLARAVLRSAASGEPELTGKLQSFNNLLHEMIVASLRGHPYPNEEKPTQLELDVAQILQQIWFASLIGWMGGLHGQNVVVERVRIAAEFSIRGSQAEW